MSAPEFSSQPAEVDPVTQNGEVDEEEVEELSIVVTEDGMVLLYSESEEWELPLSPTEARELGEALIAAAEDAQEPTE